MPTKFLQPGESSEDQKGDLDLNLVELLIDGEGDAGFNVAVDVILHPGTVDPPNRLQLGNKSRVRINNRNLGSRIIFTTFTLSTNPSLRIKVSFPENQLEQGNQY